MARPLSRRRDSRTDILKAARVEFAARGFAGGGVDRIARRARVNKAMVYYHFASKLGLYRAVLGDSIRELTAAAAAAVDASATPFAELEAYLRALLRHTGDRPELVPLMLREIADGGRNLDTDTMALMLGLFQVIAGVLERGERRGDMRPMHPLMTHFVVLGSAMLYAANEPLRIRIKQLRLPGGPRDVPIGAEPFLAYLNTVLRRALGTADEDATHA